MKRILFFLSAILIILFTSSCTNIEEKGEKDVFFKKKQVGTFDKVTIRESGMRVTEEYEIVNNGDICEISLYQLIPVSGTYEDKRTLMQSAEYDTQKLITLMNNCGFASWNGFEGKHPKNVSDGIMFRLEAEINDGEKIKAHGSENFPKGYKEFMREIRTILTEKAK